jgi:hypothetical protein
MAEPCRPAPVLLVVAAFSRHDSALAWAHTALSDLFGPVGLMSAPLAFDQTRYYEPTMGPNLRKQFLAFETLTDAAELPQAKLRTNALEHHLSATGGYQEERPLNLDPGILNLGKFMLATTKDQAHRIYLRDGIFAEVTLRFDHGAFEPWPWTYADYRTREVHRFLLQARDFYKRRLHEMRVGEGPA